VEVAFVGLKVRANSEMGAKNKQQQKLTTGVLRCALNDKRRVAASQNDKYF